MKIVIRSTPKTCKECAEYDVYNKQCSLKQCKYKSKK